MAKRASTDSDDDEEDEIDTNDDDDVDDEAKRKPLELWGTDEEASETAGPAGAVSGQSVFGFKQIKRKDALTRTVSYSTAAALKDRESQEEVRTPTKTGQKADVMKTPKSKSKSKPSKSHLLKTPHRLRRRMDQGIDMDDDSDPSFSEGSEEEEDDDDSDDEDIKNNNIGNAPAKGPTEAPPSLFETRTTPSKPKKASTKKEESDKSAKQQVEEAEFYFEAHKSNRVFTSDHTLNKLETPKLSPEQVTTLLADSPSHHAPHIRELIESHATLFRKWMIQMASNYSVLLYGLGSKRTLLEMFRQTHLERGDYDHVVVNGYFPSLTLKQIFACIIDELMDNGFRTFKSPIEQLAFLRDTLQADPRDFFVVFHNIDGVNLRKEKIQQTLSQLASLPGCHLIASLDHINAPLLWDQAKLSKFRFVWYDATTFCPYIDETSYETSLMIQQSGQLALSSLLHVIKSLTPNAKKIFVLLATEQLALGDTPTYQGMSFQDLYQRCRAEFLVNSDLTLKAQLTEFKDHKLIRVKKGNDGVEYLTIPLDNATIIEFMEDYES